MAGAGHVREPFSAKKTFVTRSATEGTASKCCIPEIGLAERSERLNSFFLVAFVLCAYANELILLPRVRAVDSTRVDRS